MVDSETIDTEFTETKEKFDEKKEKTKEKINETKEKFDETKEKGKNIADNVINDLYKSLDEFKDSIKSMQKTADQRYSEYKKATVQTIDIDFVETKENYFIKAAVPGVTKEDISIEAGDNDLTIETTFKPYIEEFDEEDEAEVIVSAIKTGRFVKITIPKLIIPKHKVNVE